MVVQWQANLSFCNQGNPSCGPPFVANWIDSHAEDAQAMGKPFVIEEYGKLTGNALPYFQTVYQKYLDSIQNSAAGVLRGDFSPLLAKKLFLFPCISLSMLSKSLSTLSILSKSLSKSTLSK